MSAIEWTDEVWNPTVGCSKVSPGCDNCYAIRVAAREMQDAHRGLTITRFDREPNGRPVNQRLDWTGEVRLLHDRLDTPLRWRKPRRVFVDSMSDLFHPQVPDDFIARVWATMHQAPQHTFQVLTKRPRRMAELLASDNWLELVQVAVDNLHDDPDDQLVREPWPPSNVWLAFPDGGAAVPASTRLGMDHMRRPVLMRRVGKKAAGRVLDGRTWDEYPSAVKQPSHERTNGPVDEEKGEGCEGQSPAGKSHSEPPSYDEARRPSTGNATKGIRA